jgi:histidinol-phosphate/aromatic aminotransferase/cobyric acid decarboxylase-like protein
VRGGERLLRAIADTYEAIAPEDVLSFAGAEEAIFGSCRSWWGRAITRC